MSQLLTWLIFPPRRDDDDYDIDFYTVGPVPPASPDVVEPQAPAPSVREQLEVRLLFSFGELILST